MRASPFPLWGKDNARIANSVRRAPGLLQIILKTRDEPLLLESWLDHHLGLIEDEAKIIVLDHMSTHEKVLELYERHAERLIVVNFEGLVDSAHCLKKFRDLYAAVWDSARYYTLLDTDEFLCLYDGFKLVRDKRILAYLAAHERATAFPTLTMTNIYGRKDFFAFSQDTAKHCHLQGKPLIACGAAKKTLRVPVGHNIDLPLSFLERTPLALVLPHLTTWPPERRIRANMLKLANFGVIASEKDFKTVMTMDESSLAAAHLREYVKEIRLLADEEAARKAGEESMRAGYVAFADDGRATFSSPELKTLFRQHVYAAADFLAALGIRREALGVENKRLSEALQQIETKS